MEKTRSQNHTFYYKLKNNRPRGRYFKIVTLISTPQEVKKKHSSQVNPQAAAQQGEVEPALPAIT